MVTMQFSCKKLQQLEAGCFVVLVVSSLTALSDNALAASLSACDRESLTELLEEYFCSVCTTDEVEEEEFGDFGM